MDGPLFTYERDLDADDADINNYSTRKRIEHALKQDNRDDFVRLINSLPCVEGQLWSIQFSMLNWDSSNCVAAVLDGETKMLNITACLGSSPLHEAVSSSAYRITALLLENGFSADARCDYASLNLTDVLPLGVVLSKLRSKLFLWNIKGRTSAVKLIIELFKEMFRQLETLRLLAQNSREVKHEFLNYLKKGKMVEVGALLLVARSRFLSSSAANGDYALGFRSISEMHDFLLDEIISYIYAKRPMYAGARLTEIHSDNKLIEMEETLLLLKIFDKIGDQLAAFIRQYFMRTHFAFRSGLAVASLIEDAGFDVKAEYLYYDNPYFRIFPEEFKSKVLERGADDCKKTAFTTYALPSWLKEAALTGLDSKSCNRSRLAYPFSLEGRPEMNSMPMPALASASSMPENMPLNHLLKQSAPLVGALKKAVKRG